MIKSRSLFSKIFILSLFFITIQTTPSSAQLFIEQGKNYITIEPGKNVLGAVTVHNTANETIQATVYWEDFMYIAPFDGKKEFYPQGTGEKSASSWITFTPQTLILEPFAKKNIEYTINVPDTIEGGYYGVLFFEREPMKPTGEKGLTVISRVGCLFFLESKTKDKTATLSDFSFAGTQWATKFSNKGNVILTPEGIFYIMDSEGIIAERGTIPSIYLPPQKSADYKFNITTALEEGKSYTLVITVDLKDGDTLIKEIDFTKTHDSIDIKAIRD